MLNEDQNIRLDTYGSGVDQLLTWYNNGELVWGLKILPWKFIETITVATMNGSWQTTNKMTAATHMMLTWVSDWIKVAKESLNLFLIFDR